ncbi:MAG TPA: ribose-phosphate diphosphokinase [Candidatus Nanoarchaeia archaeon]|nr:ribose-phosphate diphosphokinase [Candidatus Nanoarchaeia archaeon]
MNEVNMIICSLGHSDQLARSLAKLLRAAYSRIAVSHFPDGDIYLKYNCNVKGKTVILINSFQPEPNWALYASVFAAETAKDLGAQKVVLVAPYLAFMRQDKRFKTGEAVSSRIMAKLLSNCIDKIITLDAHLHRYRSLKELFKIPAVNLTANSLIASYIKKTVSQPLLMGPDWESSQWARSIAEQIGAESAVLEKTRHSYRKVTVKLREKITFKNKNVVIVDDIISTGSTIIEAAKTAKRLGAKSVLALAVHGVFVEDAYKKLKKAASKIVTTNTIRHNSNKIDITSLLVNELKKKF